MAQQQILQRRQPDMQQNPHRRLRRVKAKLQIVDSNGLKHDDVARIAAELKVPTNEVLLMNQRLGARDSSLNMPVTSEIAIERQDLLMDERPNQEELLGNHEEEVYGNTLLAEGFKVLDARFGVSRERVRQLENLAFAKVQAAVTAAAHV
jgi:RNA polymerase sigma-32 factor